MSMTVVVTGATGEIGQAVTETLSAAGYRVVAVGRSPEKLEELRSRLDGVLPVALDFGNGDDVLPPLTDIDRLDGLVHCAGMSEVASVEDTPRAVWDETMAVNVTGPAAVTRALLPALRASAGRVVFINAAPGLHAVPRWSAYTASKAALRELADALREEEDSHGVRVTTIYPAGVRTELLRKVREQLGRPYDPAATVSPKTLASLVLSIFEFPDDGHLMEITLRPAPSGSPR
jgi:NADP-dependent 3-hydroxy acid dehydrogenase YdfG